MTQRPHPLDFTRAASAIFSTRFRIGVTVSALLLGQSSPVFADAIYTTYGNYNPTNTSDTGAYQSTESDTTRVAFSRPVGHMFSIGSGKSYASTSGYADASSLKLGVSGWAVSTPGNGFFTDAYMRTEAANRFTVLPGTSGLSFGDATLLTLQIRLNGTFSADARSWPGSSWAHAEIGADLSIHDDDIRIDTGEGWWSPAQASFGADASLEAYHVYKPYWGESYSSPWDESWSMGSNVVDEISDRAFGEDTETAEGMYFTGAGFSFDTGYLTLSFEAIVGHTLDVEASLYTYVNANHEAEASAEFGHTFAFGVAPTVAGLQLDWEIPVQAQSVPDSGGLSLVATGLLILFGLRWRGARHQRR